MSSPTADDSIEIIPPVQQATWRVLLKDILQRGALLWIAGALALRLSEVAARLIAARILGPENQGVLEVLLAWIGIGALLAGGGFAPAARIHVSDTNDPDERRTVVAVGSLGILASWGVVALAGLIVVFRTSWISPVVAERLVSVLGLILLTALCDPTLGLFALLGMGLKRYAVMGRQRLLVAGLHLTGWVGGAWLGGVRGVLVGWALALAGSGAYSVVALRLVPKTPALATKRVRRVLVHACTCLGNQLSFRLAAYLSVLLLLAYQVPTSDIGNFGIAFAASRLLVIVPGMCGSLMLPYLVAVRHNACRHLKLSRMLFWTVVPMVFCLWLILSLAAKYLLPAMVPRFAKVEPLFQLLALSGVASAICRPLGIRFLSLHLPSWNLLVNMLLLVSLLLFTALWMPGSGIWGMAYVWCAAAGVQLFTIAALTAVSASRGKSER